jgi:hypothetical protein
MRRFLVCIHDAAPAHARETALMIRDLAPLVGRRLSFGVVPDWHGAWPLAAHPDFCAMLRDVSGELLLHGYFHRRQRGRGPASWLAERSDEMNGLDRDDTRRTIERGQRVFTEVFGRPARGFIAPAWQRRHVRPDDGNARGPEYILGFFSLESAAGERLPLATWTWDCGRWGWLGHVGHGVGALLQSQDRRIPVLAIHPRDLARGFWPRILRLTGTLLDNRYEPTTPAALLGSERC